MAQGTSVGRPHNSPLTKLASRPRNRPIGPTAQVTSPSDSTGMPRLLREQIDRDHAAGEAAVERHAAVPQLEDFERMGGEIRQIVKQHIAGAAAQDDAERHPQHEVVEVGERQRRLAAPQPVGAHDGARIDPADQDAENISERIPADGERAEMHQHRIDMGVGNDEKGHCGFPACRAPVARRR